MVANENCFIHGKTLLQIYELLTKIHVSKKDFVINSHFIETKNNDNQETAKAAIT